MPGEHVDRWSDLRADIARYGPRPWAREWTVYAVGVYRWGRTLEASPRQTFAWLLQDRACWFLARLVESFVGVSIPRSAVFGPGLVVQHGQGVIVHADVVAGRNCTLRQGVTLGQASFDGSGGVPVLGDDVELGPYAQVLGPVRVGDRARVGALCLVTRDVPADGRVVAPRAETR